MLLSPLEIWTVGHSNKSLEQFLELLESQRVEALADVRRFPGSRRHPQFGQEALAQSLAAKHIQYEHFPELGGRRKARPDSPNTAWRSEAFRGYADYMDTEPFRTGLERLVALARARRTAVMCAEALWWQCHRALISDYLKAHGATVWHILTPNKVEAHPYTSAARLLDGRLSYAAKESELDLPFRSADEAPER